MSDGWTQYLVVFRENVAGGIQASVGAVPLAEAMALNAAQQAESMTINSCTTPPARWRTELASLRLNQAIEFPVFFANLRMPPGAI